MEEGQHQVLVGTDIEGYITCDKSEGGHKKQGVIVWKVKSRRGGQVITQVYGAEDVLPLRLA